ncbi:hypothetical protein H2198_004302 [Neophaeococcomyces mojaviensis]|uniref:Uncharacterized protein n=1 Tax=Neophaeococcomyces mojaviensis TaxID=3383035 RepID=A0ACC3A8U9_9EURO|nr:hypothetical protein H2198_004302 [Knufia sp. JES_112]
MTGHPLTTIASSALDYETTPVTKPPPTEAPGSVPWNSSTPQPRLRIDSESTLTNDGKSDTEGVSNAAQTAQAATFSERPQLADRKFETEIQQPAETRSLLTDHQRRSTEARPNAHSPAVDESSDTESSSDDDEPHIDLQRQRSLPERKDLTPRELNRARMRPWSGGKQHHVHVGNEHFQGYGKIAKDGRLNVKISEKANTGYLAKALGNALQSHLHPHAKQAKQDALDLKKQYQEQNGSTKVPRMNIVVMVIGSRGDIQPFVAISKILVSKYGHRVRIATHPAFRKFIEDEMGLEFFSIGGDPSELMSFMVRNPGLLPSFETLTSGEVGRRREQMYEMFQGFWRACINTTDDEKDTANLKLLGKKFPFVADAVIANPVSMAHYHCAEKLGIPLHMVFTFPYTPTSAFPHPLANIKSSSTDREYTNYMTYPLIDLMTWQGLGDLVNRFRVKTLGLEPVSTLWAPGQLTRMRVPMTYLWSPGLVPKPEDWGPEIDIAGYVFLDLAKTYKPPEDLVKFLKRTEADTRPIIYVGFGSISGIKDAKAFCELIFEATVQAGVRAIVSRGWGGMGDGMDIPDGVFMIDNVPHDWLFPQLDAVVHHGGAGTTAAGIKLGKPTMIVPFFGDQPFWADMISRAGAGPKEVYPLKKLTVERFADGIKQCLQPSAREAAQAIAKSIALEGDGAENAVDSFHRSLPLSGHHSMRCDVFDDRVAAWHVKHTGTKLSALAADLLVENKQLNWNDLSLAHHKKWADFSGPGEPITGAGGVVVATFQEAFHGISTIHDSTKADWKKIEKRRQRRRGKSVSNAIVLPGKIAQQARKSREEKDHSAEPATDMPLNLTGEAAPIRKPTLPTVVADCGHTSRPQQYRTDTTSTLGGQAAPVVLLEDVGKGFGHSVKALVLLPLDMLNAVTLGFRNAPRLYGDRTVRPPPQNIKGFRQGTKIAGQELWYGFYDGTTGLVRIPYLATHEDGISGLPKGVARGMGGLVLKPIAGTLGLVNWTGKGCYASLRKLLRDTEKTERWLRRARMAQGTSEVKELREQEEKERQANDPIAAGSRHDGNLEHARTLALTKWTTDNRQKLEEAREKEKRRSTMLARG